MNKFWPTLHRFSKLPSTIYRCKTHSDLRDNNNEKLGQQKCTLLTISNYKYIKRLFMKWILRFKSLTSIKEDKGKSSIRKYWLNKTWSDLVFFCMSERTLFLLDKQSFAFYSKLSCSPIWNELAVLHNWDYSNSVLGGSVHQGVSSPS